MPIHYRIDESKFKKNSYFARVLRVKTINLAQMVKNITTRTSLSSSDINGVVIALIEEVSHALAMGKTVEIDGLVSFAISLAGSFETPDHVVTRNNAQLKVATQENLALRAQVADLTTYEREETMTKVPDIMKFFDVTTQTYNQYTPGSIIRLEGKNLKFNLAKPDEGVFVQTSGPEIRLTVYSTAGPKRIEALIPANLTGDMMVIVRTRYTPEGNLRHGIYEISVPKAP